MSNETHSFVRVSIKRKFDESNDLLSCRVDKVVIEIIQFTESLSSRDLKKLQSLDVSSISRSETSSSGVRCFGVPKLELVIVVNSQEEVFFNILFNFRVPDASSRMSFILDSKAVLNRELFKKSRFLNIIFEAFSIETNGEKAGL